MRWVGCIFRTQLRRDKQITELITSGLTRSPEKQNRKTRKKPRRHLHGPPSPAGAHIPVGWRRVEACVWGRLHFRTQLRRGWLKPKGSQEKKSTAGAFSSRCRWLRRFLKDKPNEIATTIHNNTQQYTTQHNTIQSLRDSLAGPPPTIFEQRGLQTSTTL